jgi:hypothetical protein
MNWLELITSILILFIIKIFRERVNLFRENYVFVSTKKDGFITNLAKNSV